MVSEKVKKIIIEQLGCEEEDVVNETSLDDLGADDLDKIEIVMELEEEFDIEISDNEALNFVTVGNIVDCVKVKANE